MKINTVISFSAPVELAQRVKKAVKAKDMTVSAFLREAVEQKLEDRKQDKRERS